MKQLILIIVISFLAHLYVKCQSIELDSTILSYELIVDSTDAKKAWDIEWGFDNKLWITDFRHIKRWNPSNNQLDTIWVSDYGNYLGLYVPPTYIGDTLNFYAVLDTHSIYYKAGDFAEVHKYSYSIGQDSVIEDQVIFSFHHAGEHSGGRVAMRNEHELIITTAENYSLNTSGPGHVIRIKTDGSAMEENCEGKIYSYGHRNPQGLTVLPNGNIYISEHGQLEDGDEINFIEKCKNYGWPYFDGVECLFDLDSCDMGSFLNDYRDPSLFGIDKMGPPAGMDYYMHDAIPEFKNSLILGLLHSGNFITVATLNESMDSIIEAKKIQTPFLRERDICVAPDGSVYVIGYDRSWNQQVGQYCKIFRMWNPDFTSQVINDSDINNVIEVFPNPTIDKVTIKSPSLFDKINLKLVDINGRLICNVEKLNQEYDLSHYKGQLVFLVGIVNHQRYSKKIVVF